LELEAKDMSEMIARRTVTRLPFELQRQLSHCNTLKTHPNRKKPLRMR
jgi:hypothetical protein